MLKVKIYAKNNEINLGIKQAFKDKHMCFVEKIKIYAEDDPAKAGANNFEQLVDLVHKLGKVEGALEQINNTKKLIVNKNLKADQEGKILTCGRVPKKEAKANDENTTETEDKVKTVCCRLTGKRNVFTGILEPILEPIRRLNQDKSKAETAVKNKPEAHCSKDNPIAGKAKTEVKGDKDKITSDGS